MQSCLFIFAQPNFTECRRSQKEFPSCCISSGIQTLSKPHTNIERYMHVTFMKRNTKFIQTWYNQTLDYVCMIFKFNLKEDCIYFVCNLSYVWLLYMAWYLYGPCMKFVWGLYELCMKYEFCMNFEFFDGSHILYYHRCLIFRDLNQTDVSSSPHCYEKMKTGRVPLRNVQDTFGNIYI